MTHRPASELEQALANAMLIGPSYIPSRTGGSITARDRERCEEEHRETLDRLTEELRVAREREAG